jgi:hypothetical protein
VTGIELVPARQLIEDAIDVRFVLAPGDRSFVDPGATVTVGDPLAERFRDTALAEVRIPSASSDADEHELRPGSRWGQAAHAHVGWRSKRSVEGELLYAWRDNWRIAGGEHGDPLDAPVGGIVRDAEPGVRIVLRSSGRALRGIVALGAASRGRLQLASGPSGELRAGGLDVGLAGTILVVGSRVDAETLTRARAMGVRGVVVAGLPSKERRDYLASEARQRAALHRLPPFAVLVLEGAQRRPLAGPVVGLLQALAGREVAIVTDPPALVFDAPDVQPPPVPADYVRVRAGDDAGREGRWLEALGLRRFAHGVQLEAGRVLFAEGPAVVPIGDLERFGAPAGGAQ